MLSVPTNSSACRLRRRDRAERRPADVADAAVVLRGLATSLADGRRPQPGGGAGGGAGGEGGVNGKGGYGGSPGGFGGGGVGYGATAVECWTLVRDQVPDGVDVPVSDAGVAPWTH